MGKAVSSNAISSASRGWGACGNAPGHFYMENTNCPFCTRQRADCIPLGDSRYERVRCDDPSCSSFLPSLCLVPVCMRALVCLCVHACVLQSVENYYKDTLAECGFISVGWVGPVHPFTLIMSCHSCEDMPCAPLRTTER